MGQGMGALWRRRVAHWRLLAEAAACIFGARLALAWVPFRYLIPFFERSARTPELSGQERICQRDAVRQAILTTRWRPPARNTCLHRAIAAQFMLRRRGVSTTLYYGATRQPGQALSTHAWLQDGEEGVVGYHRAQIEQCVPLARYPANRQASISTHSSGAYHEQL